MTPPPDWLATLPRERMLAELSLWSADLGRLAEEIARSAPHADLFHLDAADGHFSPDFLLFPDLVRSIRRATARPLHVHLMVADAILPDQIRSFADAGADAISLHAENAPLDAALSLVADLGLVPGLVLQLHTPVAAVAPCLDRIGILTLLNTRIGVKGQDLDPAAPARFAEARALLAARAPARRPLLAADGGNRAHTVPLLRRAGAETAVLGSLAFGDPDLAARIAWLRALPADA